jgi:hypothetical protein
VAAEEVAVEGVVPASVFPEAAVVVAVVAVVAVGHRKSP